MDDRDVSLIEKNMDKDSELKALWDEHLRFEQRLVKMEKKPYLTPQDKVEKKRIQVAKLAGKTRIEGILTKYRGSQN